MIDRQGGKTLIECDSCEEVFTGEEGVEFIDVLNAAKSDGWKVRKIAGEWLHGCPKCGVPT
jgi:uncharacterized C2H2 Zn-finger protein